MFFLRIFNLNSSYCSGSEYEYEMEKLPQESGCFGPNEPIEISATFENLSANESSTDL